MDDIKTWVCAILGTAVIMMLIDALLPNSKIRNTARMVSALIMMCVIVYPLTNIENFREILNNFSLSKIDYSKVDYSSAGLYERNAEKTIRDALGGVQGFENCNIYVTAEQKDYICYVSRIVIYCTNKNGENDEAVAAELAERFNIDTNVIFISR